jgi:glycolate oxidase
VLKTRHAMDVPVATRRRHWFLWRPCRNWHVTLSPAVQQDFEDGPDRPYGGGAAACATRLSRQLAQHGSLRARPVRQIACTIGGNVAENSGGGVHCLKLWPIGNTNVHRSRASPIEGEEVEFGSDALDAAG